MKNFWDERFSSKEYIYGKLPNQFYAEEISKLTPGKVLFPAEGEGRNSTFAAELGWNVFAFDSSVQAKKKALLLADEKKVTIQYIISSLEEFDYEKEQFDCLVLTFVHLSQKVRTQIHKKLLEFLKPGGKIIIESFSKGQLGKSSGGPQNLDMLYSKEELYVDFYSLTEVEITEIETDLDEGNHHKGNATLIRLVGTK